MARATGSFQFFAWWLLTLLCVQPQADHTRPEGDGRGRWEEEAQFSLQAPQTRLTEARLDTGDLPVRAGSWLGSHSFRALKEAKKSREGKEGFQEEAEPLSTELSY